MPYYRATFDGYIEGEYENEEAARTAMVEAMQEDYTDQYGRGPEDLVSIEEFNDKIGEWK